MPSSSELLTLTQAAALAGLDPASLRQAIHRGTLRAVKPGRDWLVSRAQLEAYLAQRPDWALRGAASRWARPTDG